MRRQSFVKDVEIPVQNIDVYANFCEFLYNAKCVDMGIL